MQKGFCISSLSSISYLAKSMVMKYFQQLGRHYSSSSFTWLHCKESNSQLSFQAGVTKRLTRANPVPVPTSLINRTPRDYRGTVRYLFLTTLLLVISLISVINADCPICCEDTSKCITYGTNGRLTCCGYLPVPMSTETKPFCCVTPITECKLASPFLYICEFVPPRARNRTRDGATGASASSETHSTSSSSSDGWNSLMYLNLVWIMFFALMIISIISYFCYSCWTRLRRLELIPRRFSPSAVEMTSYPMRSPNTHVSPGQISLQIPSNSPDAASQEERKTSSTFDFNEGRVQGNIESTPEHGAINFLSPLHEGNQISAPNGNYDWKQINSAHFAEHARGEAKTPLTTLPTGVVSTPGGAQVGTVGSRYLTPTSQSMTPTSQHPLLIRTPILRSRKQYFKDSSSSIDEAMTSPNSRRSGRSSAQKHDENPEPNLRTRVLDNSLHETKQSIPGSAKRRGSGLLEHELELDEKEETDDKYYSDVILKSKKPPKVVRSVLKRSSSLYKTLLKPLRKAFPVEGTPPPLSLQPLSLDSTPYNPYSSPFGASSTHRDSRDSVEVSSMKDQVKEDEAMNDIQLSPDYTSQIEKGHINDDELERIAFEKRQHALVESLKKERQARLLAKKLFPIGTPGSARYGWAKEPSLSAMLKKLQSRNRKRNQHRNQNGNQNQKQRQKDDRNDNQISELSDATQGRVSEQHQSEILSGSVNSESPASLPSLPAPFIELVSLKDNNNSPQKEKSDTDQNLSANEDLAEVSSSEPIVHETQNHDREIVHEAEKEMEKDSEAEIESGVGREEEKRKGKGNGKES